MDPVKSIKDHVITLNTVSYDDDASLELYLVQVKETLREVFGAHSQYLTYLGSIQFRPIFAMSSPEESIRAWGKGKRQLRDLLFVVLEDPLLKGYESWDERELEREAVGEVQEAERIVECHQKDHGGLPVKTAEAIAEAVRSFQHKVQGDLSVAREVHCPKEADVCLTSVPKPFPRVRIDLSDLHILDDGLEEFLVHQASLLSKDPAKTVLFFPSSDQELNARIRKFLGSTEAVVAEFSGNPRNEMAFQEYLSENVSAQMAIVALADDCWIRFKDDGLDVARSGPSPAVCFQMGCLVSKLGRGKVLALHGESPRFRRPTGYFDLFYVPLTASGAWRDELVQRFKQNKIAVKSESHPVFYRG